MLSLKTIVGLIALIVYVSALAWALPKRTKNKDEEN